MKYINKEYGFTFRPPFFDKFIEIKNDGPEITDDAFPGKYLQGAGYDYSAINGAMLIGKNGSLWGVKVSYYNGKKWLDNDDFIKSMGSGCANTADGSFAHFSSGPLSVKWVRHNEQSMIVQVGARKKLRVRVIFYPCYNWVGELSIEGQYAKGRSHYVGILGGDITLSDTTAVYKERYQVILDDSEQKEYFMAYSYNRPSDTANGAFNEAIMEFVINKNQPSVYIYASVGGERLFDMAVPRIDRIKGQIETAELRYGVNKTFGSGVLGAGAERMLNSVLWSRIYYPYLLREIYSPKRSMLTNHFNIDGLEENCSALLGSLAYGSTNAEAQLKYTVEDRIFSILSVWHIFSRLSDKGEIKQLYQRFTKLYPPVAKLVYTTDSSKKEVAYKWGDSILKEIKNSVQMYSLDLSCLKMLAFDILERIALSFDLPESKQYAKAREEMGVLINDTFWNNDEGLYINRYMTGVWAATKGATSFYPLIAGAVDSGEKLSLLINNLLNPKLFWADYPIPTLCINNKEYGKKGKPNNNGVRNPPYLQYRGSIVPYVNYLIYHGLVRYGLDEIAAKLAVSSAKLWANNQSDNVENYSMYLPTGGKSKASEYLSSNGNMLALIGIQELIDLEYFRPDLQTQSLRFGTFAFGTHSLSNFRLVDKTYSIEVDELSTTLLLDNAVLFRGDGGKFVVRNFLFNNGGCEFIIDSHSNINISLSIPSGAKKNTKYFFIVPVGKSRVYAWDGMVNIQVI